MARTLQLFIKIASDVGLVHSMRELFCVCVPKSQTNQKTEKSTNVVQSSQTQAETTTIVGLVRFFRGISCVKVGRAQLYVPAERNGLKTYETCGFDGIRKTSKRGRP